ncbi:Agamous-like MADS-box protein AGL80, partial [Cucurbita argyrosperma subsp. argyrosperma]
MTRKKVKLTFITNDAARKATFKKRKKGFLKKLTELTTLCGIDACAIIFSPFNSYPDLWPSLVGVQRVISHFKALPEMEQCKKMVNQETFLRHRIAKAADQLKKLQRENREKEIAHVMFQTLVAGGAPRPTLNVIDLNDLGWLVDQKMADICKRIELLRSAVAVEQNQPPCVATVEPSWFIEMVNQECDDQMRFNIGDDVIQLPTFGEDGWPNNAFFP